MAINFGFIKDAITSVLGNESAKQAIVNAAITKVAGGSDKAAIASGLGTYASQEYGIPGIPGIPGTPPINDPTTPYNQTAMFSINQAIDAARSAGDLDQVAVLQEELKKYQEPKTPEFIKTIGDYLGFGGLDTLKEKYLDKDSAFRTPLGEGLPSPSGLALPALLGYMAYDSAKDRKGGIALTPQVMMDSLGRYQMASDMGTGGTRAEFGLGPKPSVLNVAGGGEINRQYFNQGGIAELDMRDGGESAGPGTGTSDDIPAMLSDGEFVMTAAATKGAGAFDLSTSDSGITLVKTDNPDRERGVENMRELMNIFEEI